MKNIVLTLVIFSIIFITGCATKYSVIYESVLSKSENLLSIEDEFEFIFFPTYNGIVFEIRNNSDQTARIIWDKSYFIMPDGNSFKALNTDILKEDYEVVAKAKYVSTIPSNSKFKRFTTSALNSTKMHYTTTSEFNSRFDVNSFSYTQIVNEEFILSNPYWIPTIVIDSTVTDTTVSELLKPISDFINTHNNLGLGLVLEQNGTEKEYRFDFKIKKAHFIQKRTDSSNLSGKTTTEYYLEYTFDVEKNKWENVHKELD